jgi:hypothetical protein
VDLGHLGLDQVTKQLVNITAGCYAEVGEMRDKKTEWLCPRYAKPKTKACSSPSTQDRIRQHIAASHPREKRGPLPAVVVNPPWAS